MKILVVEDDVKVGPFLVRVLGEEGYTVELCRTAAEATSLAKDAALVVLDRMLPDGDGLTVCKSMRDAGLTIPVLVLTARGEVGDRVGGLDAGADDYLIKPFEIDELTARVRALLRRASAGHRLQIGALELDRVGHRAWLAGKSLSLTSKEYALLAWLMSKSDKPVSRVELLAQVWETENDPGSNLVEVHVSRLREKLGAHAGLIETVRGAGYRFKSPTAS